MTSQGWKLHEQTSTVFHILYWDLHSHLLCSCTIRIADTGKRSYTKSLLTVLCVFIYFSHFEGGNKVMMATVYLYSSLNFVPVLAVSLMWHSDIHLSLPRTPSSS